MKALKLEYDVKKYNFADLLCKLYNIDDLSMLHLRPDKSYQAPEGLEGIGKDTNSKLHTLFYDKIRSGWQEFVGLYEDFVAGIVLPEIDNNTTIYQSLPSYRIQYPFSKAVTTNHHDSDENHRHPSW